MNEWALIICALVIIICHSAMVYLFCKRIKWLEDIIFEIKYDRINNPKQVVSEKKPGANRNPRTEEQRAKASAKRKEWWDRKRALEAKTPEP